MSLGPWVRSRALGNFDLCYEQSKIHLTCTNRKIRDSEFGRDCYAFSSETLADFVTQRVAVFLDLVFLQQDAFDDVDCACKPERQKALLDMVYAAATRSYAFKDKTAARDYFTKLSGLHKNLNYAPAGSNDFHRIAKAIDDLDKSVATIVATAATASGGDTAPRSH